MVWGGGARTRHAGLGVGVGSGELDHGDVGDGADKRVPALVQDAPARHVATGGLPAELDRGLVHLNDGRWTNGMGGGGGQGCV